MRINLAEKYYEANIIMVSLSHFINHTLRSMLEKYVFCIHKNLWKLRCLTFFSSFDPQGADWLWILIWTISPSGPLDRNPYSIPSKMASIWLCCKMLSSPSNFPPTLQILFIYFNMMYFCTRFPRPLLTFASVITILILILGVLGNSLTIFALLKCPRVRNVAAVFIIRYRITRIKILQQRNLL